KPALVLGAERPTALVQRLCDTDRPAVLREDRHAEDAAREVAALLVERRIEAEVGVRVWDADRLTGREDRASDAEVVREAQLAQLQLVDDVAEQLAGLLVVKEQRRPVAVEETR